MIAREPYFSAIGYTPHHGQQLYHNSPARFRVPCCGRRFGKSVMAARDLEPKLFTPKNRFWAVGPTYDLGEKEFRVVWDDLIIKRGLGRDKRVRKAYNKRSGEMWIEFPWQTRFEVRSAEHPEYLVGEALNGVIMSEAAKHKQETWEKYIRPALTDHRGFADFPTTPEGFNWLYLLWQFGQNPEHEGVYESWRFPSWTNPHVYPLGREDPEIRVLERTTTPEWFAQEIGADFASFVGKIYGEFDETAHVKPHVFNPAWPNYITFDWGYVNPLAAIEFQVSPWDVVYVWRQHYLSYTRLEDHIRILKSREQPDGYRLDLAFGDAEDPEAAATVSEQMVPCIALPEAKTNWRQGVDLVKKFLKLEQTGVQDEFGTPLEEPRLYIDPRCPDVIREFNNYKAPNRRSPADIQERGRKGGALKVDDHALDAIRYGLMHRFELGVTHHLAEVVSMDELVSSAPESGYFTTAVNF